MVGVVQQNWLSNEEKQLAAKLKEAVKDKLPPEYFLKSEDDQIAFLLRWLRARDLNLNKAENMLVNALAWRKEVKIENVFDRDIDPLMVDMFPKFLSADKKGRPVAVCPFYNCDFRKLIAHNKLDQVDFFARKYFEVVSREIEIENSKRKPGEPPITQFLSISDVKGFAYGQVLNMSAMRKWFSVAAQFEAYYPELLYKCIIINVPYAFTVFLNMCKPFLAPKTAAKMTCYASVEDWQKDMEKFIDPSILPPQYGGTRKESL